MCSYVFISILTQIYAFKITSIGQKQTKTLMTHPAPHQLANDKLWFKSMMTKVTVFAMQWVLLLQYAILQLQYYSLKTMCKLRNNCIHILVLNIFKQFLAFTLCLWCTTDLTNKNRVCMYLQWPRVLKLKPALDTKMSECHCIIKTK